MLIDTHAHLDDPRLDADSIATDMASNGLGQIITVGCSLSSSRAALEIAKKHKDIYAAVGVHPSDVSTLSDSALIEITNLAAHEKVVAIGEIGLDYHYESNPRQTQKYWLERQLEAFSSTGLPVIFHLRDAYEDMRAIVCALADKIKGSAVMHCFSGSKETAQFYAGMGFYISFSGAITFKNAIRCDEIIRAVPRDRILIETDCPYLAPEPFRGRLNTPAYVRFTAMKVAAALNESYEYVENLTRENTYRLFFKMKRK